MKAIGMRVTDIRNLYLAIYAAMAVAGGALGFLLSLPVREQMQAQIRLNFGDSGNPALSVLAGIAAAAGAALRHRPAETFSDDLPGAGHPVWHGAGKWRLYRNLFASKKQKTSPQPAAGYSGCPVQEKTIFHHAGGNHSGRFYHDCAPESVPHHIGP